MTEAEQIIAWLERQDRIGFAFATLIKRGEHRKSSPPNRRTPMEANEAMIEMAKSIAARRWPKDSAEYIIARDAALAAIMETQEACAKLADEHGSTDDDAAAVADAIAHEIRTGEHYAPAGSR